MADETILLKIKVDNDKAQKDIEEQTRKVDLLKEANKKLLKENKELSKQGSVTAKQRSENSKQIALNRSKIAESNTTIRDSIKALKAQQNSYGAMKVRLKEVSQAIDKVDLSTEAGQRKVKKLREEQNKLNTALKDGEAQGGSFSRNVGNYTNSLKGLEDAIKELKTSQNELDITTKEGKEEYKQINNQINIYETNIKNVTKSTTSFTSNIKNAVKESGAFGGALDGLTSVFKASPIGILVTVLGGLVAAFSKTEKGAKVFAIAGAAINTVFNELVGLLGSIPTLFSELSLEDIGNSIKTYLIDQVKLVLKGFELLGSAFVKLFEGDFSGAIDSAGEGLKTLYIDSNPLVQVTKVLTEKTIDLTKNIVDNTNKTIENASARFDLERSILSTQKTIAKQIKEEERLNKIADDATLSLNKQKKANEDYEVALNKRLGTELTLLEQQEKILQADVDILENAKIGGQELLDARQILTDKQIEISQKETEQQQAVYDQQQRDRQINQDQWEQDLDFIIDIGLRRAEQLKKQSEDESLSLFERTQALKQYTEAIKGVQEGIINSFEESGLSEEEFNRLLGIRDPEQLAEEIRKLEELSEVENNRLKEGLQEFIIAEQEKTEAQRSFSEARIKQVDKEVKEETKRRSKLADYTINLASNVFRSVGSFLKQGSAEQKAFAIADATINTYAGVTKALKETTDFTPTQSLRFANAAAVGITGFAQVAKIASTSPSGGGGAGGASITPPSSGAGAATPQISTNAIDQQLQQQEALIAATNNIGMSISVTEINDVQQSVNISEQTATI